MPKAHKFMRYRKRDARKYSETLDLIQRERLMEAFRAADKRSENLILTSEILSALEFLGIQVTIEEFDQARNNIFSTKDCDQCGLKDYFSYQDFCRFVRHFERKGMHMEYLQQNFDKLDCTKKLKLFLNSPKEDLMDIAQKLQTPGPSTTHTL